MKGISMWQPWASLWLTDAKIHETRSRRFNYRGWLAVHATQKLPDPRHATDPELEAICVAQFGEDWRINIPRGMIIGAVLVCRCYPAVTNNACSENDIICGNWSAYRYAILRGFALSLETPIPQKGKRSVPFDITEDAAAEISRQIDKRRLPRFMGSN